MQTYLRTGTQNTHFWQVIYFNRNCMIFTRLHKTCCCSGAIRHAVAITKNHAWDPSNDNCADHTQLMLITLTNPHADHADWWYSLYSRSPASSSATLCLPVNIDCAFDCWLIMLMLLLIWCWLSSNANHHLMLIIIWYWSSCCQCQLCFLMLIDHADPDDACHAHNS